MKKIISLLLALVLCLSLCACSKDSWQAGDSASNCNHNYQITENVASTCIANGYILYTCSLCQHTYRLEQPAIEHIYKEATCTSPKTCSTCGATFGEPAEHRFANATCTSPQTCTVCGITTGEPTGHTFANATCTTPMTCTTCGVTNGSAPGHNYTDATCSAPMTCTVCGATSGDTGSHVDNGQAQCQYCGEDMLLDILLKTVTAKLIVSHIGAMNCQFSMQISNHSGYDISFTDIGTGNGELCWNKSNDGDILQSGHKVTVTYYRAYGSDRYNDRYYDMYMDQNSTAYVPVNVNGRRVYIKANINGDIWIGYTRGDIGEVD
ncbi:MAG: hypothetical protein E7470_08130 [Ruminococcaceae bacterium]|nr:hypothetical protein [Oscillospiraceae bacterium]